MSFPCVSLIECQVPHNVHCMLYLVSVAPLAWYLTPILGPIATQVNCMAIHPQMMKVSGEWQISRICMVICDNVGVPASYTYLYSYFFMVHIETCIA